jgi:hypothetical protein
MSPQRRWQQSHGISAFSDRPAPFVVVPGDAMTVRLLTTEKVAVRFRTSPATVRYWRHVGIGPAGIKVGRRVLYDEAECDRWWETKVANARNGFN